MIKTKSIIAAFLARIELMEQHLGRREYSQFPNLQQSNCYEDDVLVYVGHLNALNSDIQIRFEDILKLKVPQWVINPYDMEEADVQLQEELLRIRPDEELKVQFKEGYQLFWLQKNTPSTYPIF